MDSRLIFESSKTYGAKIKWTRDTNADSEWLYFDLDNPDILEYLINTYFIVDTLHVALGRHNSFTADKTETFKKVKQLIGQTDFNVWNENFTKTIEVNKIGVFRTGYASS
jgi:hypothetical protein